MDIQTLKGKLEQEQARLELELTDLGYLNPSNPSDWIASAPKGEEPNTADLSNLADTDEEQETNKAIVNELEVRLKSVNEALARIAAGTYGACMICGTRISEERLEANPAAATCITCA